MADERNTPGAADDAQIHGNVERTPGYATSAESSGQNRNARHSELVDPGAETPRRAAAIAHETGLDQARTDDQDDSARPHGGADVRIERGAADGDTTPPPSAHRPDSMVRAVSGEARQEMERGDQQRNESNFTKGRNAPTLDQSRYPYTVEDMDAALSEAPRPIFPDAPGGDGATPLSVERDTFLANMQERARFASDDETVRWAQAVFNGIRERAITQDETLGDLFSEVIRIGEAPEVAVEEMMWGGDFIGRMQKALAVDSSWTQEQFYSFVAQEADASANDPWVEAAVSSFLGTLKSYLGDEAPEKLNELQAVWDRA